MPNWCKGILRLRGTLQQLKTFVEEGCVKDDGELILRHDNDTGFNYELNDEPDDEPYIKKTYRAFLTGDEIYTVKDHHTNDMYILVCEFKQAWNVLTDNFEKIAQKYHVDIKIDAFERGMRFSRHITIVDNTVTNDETRNYANYFWDCVCPTIGG